MSLVADQLDSDAAQSKHWDDLRSIGTQCEAGHKREGFFSHPQDGGDWLKRSSKPAKEVAKTRKSKPFSEQTTTFRGVVRTRDSRRTRREHGVRPARLAEG